MNIEALQGASIFVDKLSTPTVETFAPQNQVSSVEFSDLVMSGINQLNNSVENANSAVQNYAIDQSIPTHEVMMALEQAELSMKLAVEVRNKLAEAYQKISRMRI